MRRFIVNGMSCASCSMRVEKAVSKIEGVDVVSVNLLTNSMNVEGSATDESIQKAVSDAGYSCFPEGKAEKDVLVDKETPKLKKRLFSSLLITLILMYFSMGHMMWSWPLPSFFTSNHISIGIIEMFLSSIVLVINMHFFISGWKGFRNHAPNMDTLVSLGSGVSYLWSLYLLLDACYRMGLGDTERVMEDIHSLYFESSAMILTLITVGKTLEAKSRGKTTDALKNLSKLKSTSANLLIDGKEVVTDIERVKVGDIFTLKSGEQIPVDGVILKGKSAVDESSLTGESIPVDKEEGDRVSSGTINLSGYLVCRAEKVGEDTSISQIIKLVEETASSKAPISKAADKVSGVFVPVVMTIAFITTLIWLIVTKDIGYSLARGISVLVISCPCALGLATPVAIMVSSGVGARNGILYKSAASIEELGKISVVALDKTGTITEGKSVVNKVYSYNENEEETVKIAASLEKLSDHPLSKAVTDYATLHSIETYSVKDARVVPGKGIEGYIDGKLVKCGNEKFISTSINNADYLDFLKEKVRENGTSLIYVLSDNTLIGLITVSDRIKKDSAEAVEKFKKMGLRVVVITGDNENTARNILSSLNVDDIISGVLPDRKSEEVRKLKAYGRVAFIGDGINDSPALTESDVGIALGSGTDIAIDSASVVLMKSSLMDAVGAINLSRSTLRNIYENLFWAFIYNAIGIPLAAGAFIHLFGWTLSPMFGALSMSLSSFCVVTNALRLNMTRIYSVKNRKIKSKVKTKEDYDMERIIKVDGMMCHHCEMRVEKALSEIDGVAAVKADHEKKEVRITLTKNVDESLLKKQIEKEGYKVF